MVFSRVVGWSVESAEWSILGYAAAVVRVPVVVL